MSLLVYNHELWGDFAHDINLLVSFVLIDNHSLQSYQQTSFTCLPWSSIREGCISNFFFHLWHYHYRSPSNTNNQWARHQNSIQTPRNILMSHGTYWIEERSWQKSTCCWSCSSLDAWISLLKEFVGIFPHDSSGGRVSSVHDIDSIALCIDNFPKQSRSQCLDLHVGHSADKGPLHSIMFHTDSLATSNAVDLCNLLLKPASSNLSDNWMSDDKSPWGFSKLVELIPRTNAMVFISFTQGKREESFDMYASPNPSMLQGYHQKS